MTTISYSQQSILQTVENDEASALILLIINMFLSEIFGDENQQINSFFLNTTPRKFLFEGVRFCDQETDASEIVCSIVRQEESASIIDDPNSPGLLFSMFNHASFHWNVIAADANSISSRKIRHMTDFMRLTLEFEESAGFCKLRDGISAEHSSSGMKRRVARHHLVNRSTAQTQPPQVLSGRLATTFTFTQATFAGKRVQTFC